MPADVASLIDGDNYDAVVPVAADTEVLTQAQLTDSAVALGNRIEFIRRALPEISDEPESVVLVRDDFMTISYNLPASSGKFINSEHVWTCTETGTVAVSGATTAKNPGQIFCFLPGDAANNKFVFSLLQQNSNVFDFAQMQSMTWVMKVDGNAANVTARSTVGLFDSVSDPFGASTNSLCIVGAAFAGLVNWRVLSRKASVSTFTDIFPFTNNEYVKFRFQRTLTGDVEVYANGSLVHTVTAANLPVGGCTLGGVFSDDSGDVASTTSYVDFVALRGDTAARQGP